MSSLGGLHGEKSTQDTSSDADPTSVLPDSEPPSTETLVLEVNMGNGNTRQIELDIDSRYTEILVHSTDKPIQVGFKQVQAYKALSEAAIARWRKIKGIEPSSSDEVKASTINQLSEDDIAESEALMKTVEYAFSCESQADRYSRIPHVPGEDVVYLPLSTPTDGYYLGPY